MGLDYCENFREFVCVVVEKLYSKARLVPYMETGIPHIEVDQNFELNYIGSYT